MSCLSDAPNRNLPRAGLALALLAWACSRSEASPLEPSDTPPADSRTSGSEPTSDPSTESAREDGPKTSPDVPRTPSTARGSTEQEPPTPGIAEAPPAEGTAVDDKRVYIKTRYVWIRAVPDTSTQWIGYLWHGASVRLRDEKPVVGNGCSRFYAIEPRGYVCVDGDRATLDPEDPEYLAIRPYSPDVQSPWPHRYGESLGGVRYRALPSLEEQGLREGNIEERLKLIEAARAGKPLDDRFDGVDLTPGTDEPIRFDSVPSNLQIPRNFLKRESTVAYTRAVEHLGRTFLLTGDFTWMPKDKVKRYPKVDFKGVPLGSGVTLPIAFFRKKNRPGYERQTDGSFSESGKVFPRLSWVKLTGTRATHADEEFLETEAQGWVRADDAVVPEPSKTTPWGAKVGQPDTTEHQPRGRKTWVEVSVLGGWLVAFEGTRAVYATMISPGRGGTPVKGKSPVSTASTPTGRFRITGKFATANMETSDEFIHSDVPWTQNFSGPHALHTAYWHNDWGELKSGGCINVSPIDGKWLYEFTEPQVPEDWHGLRWNPKAEASTQLIVHR